MTIAIIMNVLYYSMNTPHTIIDIFSCKIHGTPQENIYSAKKILYPLPPHHVFIIKMVPLPLSMVVIQFDPRQTVLQP